MSKTLFTKAEIERTEKGMTAIASTSVVDRQGESISVGGWDLRNFKKNPVLLWSHNHDEVAVGKAKGIKVVGTGKSAQLVFQPVFHDKTPLAAAIKSLFEGDDTIEPVLNSFSVGFRPIDVDGNTYIKQELLEISAVNVPANPEARVMAYKSLKKAGVKADVIKQVGVDIKQARIDELENKVKSLNERLDNLTKGSKPQVTGRKAEVETTISALKVIQRANEKLLTKSNASKTTQAKIVKTATERLLSNYKKQLKGN